MIETDKDNASFRFTVDNFFRSILRRFGCGFFLPVLFAIELIRRLTSLEQEENLPY